MKPHPSRLVFVAGTGTAVGKTWTAAAVLARLHDSGLRWYGRALAPPMAAAALGAPAFTVADLAGELCWPDGCDVGLVEGAGGPRSPIAVDGDNVTLAAAVAADLVLLVAAAGLGAINAVRMSVDAFAGVPIVVVLNGYDEGDMVHTGNRHWLRDRDGYDVVTGPESAAARIVP